MNIKLHSKVEKFIYSLDKIAIAKILHSIELLEVFGYNLGMPHSKKIANTLYELRIRGTQEIRIFYTFHNDDIILIHGFIKKTQKIPAHEIQTAEKRLKNLLEK